MAAWRVSTRALMHVIVTDTWRWKATTAAAASSRLRPPPWYAYSARRAIRWRSTTAGTARSTR